MEKRPCSKCQQHVASVKFTTIRNGMVEERHLCQQCAATQSPYQKKAMPQLDEILSGILGVAAANQSAQAPAQAELTCSTCGLPYSSYRQTLILGCSDCYTSFEKLLVNELRRFHGETRHTGRVPQSQVREIRNARSAEDLKARLAEAVKAEDFKLAAELRDQIKELAENTN